MGMFSDAADSLEVHLEVDAVLGDPSGAHGAQLWVRDADD